MKKIFLIIFLFLDNAYANIQIQTIVKVDEKIITNIDIINEINVIKTIFENFPKEKKTIEDLAVNNLINEIIKKNEIIKNNIIIQNNLIDIELNKILKNISNQNINDKILKLIKNKIELEIQWNTLISRKFSWKVNINMKEIDEKINKNKSISKSEKDLLDEKDKLINFEKNKKLQIYSNNYLNSIKSNSLIKFYK